MSREKPVLKVAGTKCREDSYVEKLRVLNVANDPNHIPIFLNFVPIATGKIKSRKDFFKQE